MQFQGSKVEKVI
uniref:Uncharacterized protein n=1 Tax=Arundo donax TaxID=35708 RepID=A0A0A9ALL7_ARUDO